MIASITTAYGGRQTDIELLQTIVELSGEAQRVYLSNVRTAPKYVAGVQKALQRYTLLFLSELGSVKFADELGTSFLQTAAAGYMSNMGTLVRTFSTANAAVLSLMAADDADTDTFGSLPDDERLAGVTLLDADIDRASSTIRLTLEFTMASGTSTEYVLPVSALG